MESIIEFLIGHPYLSGAWTVVAVLLLIAQFQHMRNGVKSIVPQQVTHLINKEDALVIDMRAIADFNKGHIAGSKNIPQSKLDSSEKELEKYKNTPIIMVCASGVTAGPAASKLKKAGFEQVFRLAGGYQSWVGENLPVVRS
ncbi:rhodanese-like domain-containing protein [Pleionea litopenaei]|uniref:Rhodanese-like domain-containing protein n=1 Tax=Pleionea litopenaei TaxID=3070815 RepID=A0AA51RQJ7_9GAMM|nr:rhodanese-like domain-containing protein [Pleionea sp. HL-JVS1]WMS85776.1 rhodanese-like domain-containing protein [Pleionea sp. HL-JVS1]